MSVVGMLLGLAQEIVAQHATGSAAQAPASSLEWETIGAHRRCSTGSRPVPFYDELALWAEHSTTSTYCSGRGSVSSPTPTRPTTASGPVRTDLDLPSGIGAPTADNAGDQGRYFGQSEAPPPFLSSTPWETRRASRSTIPVGGCAGFLVSYRVVAPLT